jgi:hypothetical protein
VHERQTDISHSVLGAMQATETLETPWICRNLRSVRTSISSLRKFCIHNFCI